MVITLTLEDDVLELLQAESKRTGETIEQVICRVLRAELTRPEGKSG